MSQSIRTKVNNKLHNSLIVRYGLKLARFLEVKDKTLEDAFLICRDSLTSHPMPTLLGSIASLGSAWTCSNLALFHRQVIRIRYLVLEH